MSSILRDRLTLRIAAHPGMERHAVSYIEGLTDAVLDELKLTEERVTASIATVDQRHRDSATRRRWVSEWRNVDE
jgi:hypothetical protein